MLYADSAFAFQLHWSNQPNKKDFDTISNALFKIKKNGLSIEPKFKVLADGKYISDDTCKNGDTYAIQIFIPDFSTVSSQTKIPNKPIAKCTEVKQNAYSQAIYDLSIKDIALDAHALYIYLFSKEIDSEGNSKWNQSNLYGNVAYADAFNRIYDAWAPDGFVFEYESFIRIPTENLRVDSLHFNVAPFIYSSSVKLYVLSATKEWDLYFKGSYLQRSFDPEVSLPFAYEPIFLPHNIQNGAGIFAGIDVVKFDFTTNSK